jgi:upstream activation factor subunit UAF30
MVKTKRAGLKKTTKKSKIVTNKTQKSGKSKKNTDVVEEEVVSDVSAPKIEPVEKVNTDMEVLDLEKKENKKVNKKRVTKNKKGSRSSKKTKQSAVVDVVEEPSSDIVVEETPVVDVVEVEETSAVEVEETPVVVEVEETPAVDVVVEETPAVVVEENEKEEIVETDINLLGKNLLNLTSTLTELLKQVKSVQNDMKVIQKQYNKVSKEHEKMLKKKRNSKNNKPSGFAIPSSLSDEMLDFLGLEKGIKVPRNEVLKLINKYIVENELRQEEDKRNILPDKKLKKLLNVKKNDKVTYFNLQSYLKPHFIKT